jgi:hypothetical protein
MADAGNPALGLLAIALVLPGFAVSSTADLPEDSLSAQVVAHAVSALFFGAVAAVAAIWSTHRRFGLGLAAAVTAGAAMLAFALWTIATGLAARAIGGP